MEQQSDLAGGGLEKLKERCRDAGMNVTPQRIAVYRALLGATDHPTPEILYEIVRREIPSISQATIYKALEALQRLGVVHEILRTGEARRYEANIGPHQHLVCTRCGRIGDFHDGRLGSIRPPDGIDGFHSRDVRIQVLGLCSPCADLENPDNEI
jgi:Fur family peroxide stress response transcriptional regulator